MPSDSLLDDFDHLVSRASCGDAHAVGAIALGLAPSLLAAAHEIADPDVGGSRLLSDFLNALSIGEVGTFRPRRERALHWLERALVRFAARRRREHRAERVWENEEDTDGDDDDDD